MNVCAKMESMCVKVIRGQRQRVSSNVRYTSQALVAHHDAELLCIIIKRRCSFHDI